MKALAFHGHGTLENVSYTDILEPSVGPHDVKVAIKAAALNRLDLWVLAGWPGLKLKLPHVMGSDGAGVVVEVGAEVTSVSVGDRVAINPSIVKKEDEYTQSGRDNLSPNLAILGEHIDGAAAEFAVVPAVNLLKMPEGIDFASAAAASLVYVTAWHSLITRGGMRPGEDILVVGAGGGVNTASIQIARYAGARNIYVVGSSDEKLAQAEALGANVLINRNNEDWGRALFKLTNRRGVDIVIDNVGAATYHKSLRALARGGRLLTVGNTAGPKFEIDNRLLFGKHLSIIGSTMGPRQDYATVMNLVFNGSLKPTVDTVYPLSEGLTALQRLEQGDVIGKLVLQPE